MSYLVLLDPSHCFTTEDLKLLTESGAVQTCLTLETLDKLVSTGIPIVFSKPMGIPTVMYIDHAYSNYY